MPAKTHGLSSTNLYRAWQQIIQRCENPKHGSYVNYGGRGITICDRWRGSFEAFRLDMGDPPPGTTLDRLDNDLGYDPSNCAWRTRSEQNNNSRHNHRISFDGLTLTVMEWSKRIGIRQHTLLKRLARWPLDKALTTPKQLVSDKRTNNSDAA